MNIAPATKKQRKRLDRKLKGFRPECRRGEHSYVQAEGKDARTLLFCSACGDILRLGLPAE